MPAVKPGPHAGKKERRKAASADIAAEMRTGKYPRRQAIAIGLSEAGLSRKQTKKRKGKR